MTATNSCLRCARYTFLYKPDGFFYPVLLFQSRNSSLLSFYSLSIHGRHRERKRVTCSRNQYPQVLTLKLAKMDSLLCMPIFSGRDTGRFSSPCTKSNCKNSPFIVLSHFQNPSSPLRPINPNHPDQNFITQLKKSFQCEEHRN